MSKTSDKIEQQRNDIQGQINILEDSINDNEKTWNDYLESGILPNGFKNRDHLAAFLDQDTEQLQNELHQLYMAWNYCGEFEFNLIEEEIPF